MTTNGRARRAIVAMIDGFGTDYLAASAMPNLKRMAREGFSTEVEAVFPSITNVNNVSIACNAWPDAHGITGNSYYDATSGEARYMNGHAMIRAETVFRRAARHGVGAALLTSKRKTVELFEPDTALAVAGERPPEDLVQRHGRPGEIYSAEINVWLWTVAVDLLRTRPDLGLIYVHTTDYPMHRWAPEADPSRDHLARLDALIGEAAAAAPDAAIYVTADHGMNAKTRSWDLTRVCAEAGVPLRFCLSPERDYYIKHHRNFTGGAFVWLNAPSDATRVTDLIAGLEGIEAVLPAAEVAARFHTIADRLGDLVVFADRYTMIGDMDIAYEDLHDYRAHGSLHEMAIPLIIHDPEDRPRDPADYRSNKDLLRGVFD